MVEKTKNDIKKEVNELVENINGKVNNFDSRKDKEDVVSDILNKVVAGVDLSKNEKAGIMWNLLNRRTN